MANHTFKDADGTKQYRKATGAGSDVDPAILHNIVESSALPTGATTETTLDAIKTAAESLDTSALAIESGGNLAAAATSLSVIDDWDESDRAKVNIVAGQAGITAGAGSVAASTPRVTLASDDPAVAALQIIDDWDESDRAKVNIVAGQAGITAGAGSVAANTPRVTLASDDPAVVALQTLDNAISGNEIQADIVTMPAIAPQGCSGYSVISTAAVLSAVIKGSAGEVHGIQCFNLNASPRFVRIYNQTGAPGSGDSANIIWRGMIPGNTAATGFVVPLFSPITCSTGIGIRASTGIADNDTGALAANELIFNVQYK